MKRLIIMLAVFWMACMIACSGASDPGEEGTAAAQEAGTAEEALEAEEIQAEEGIQENGEEVNWEDNGIPVISLEIDPGEFDKVNESPDHSYRASGAYISVLAEEDSRSLTGLELDYIRGRGHGTWSADKKAYRLKLKEGADLLGLGKNKHWVLLANRYDTTLLRNRTAAYMGQEIGLSYTPGSLPVDLVVNGEYYGSYVLSEQVRIGKSRIEIDSLEPEDLEEPEITGGYLVCLSPGYEEDPENVFLTDRLVRFGCEEPKFSQGEDGVPAQKAYIADYIQKTDDAVFAAGAEIAEGPDWTDYMDKESAAAYWWIQEFTGNHDAFITSSTYLYKERGGKLFWGPLWDFDLSLGDGLDASEGFLHRNMIWLDHLRAYDQDYQDLLCDTWTRLDPVIEDLVKDGGVIDTWSEEIRRSWEDDQRRWPLPEEYGEEGQKDFDAEVDRLKSWMKLRQAWIRQNIDTDLCHVYNTVTFRADGDVCQTREVLSGYSIDRLPQAPCREGFVFSHWTYENGQPYEYESIDRDTLLEAVYLTREEAGITEGLFFVNPREVWADLQSKRYEPVYELVPEDTIDRYIQWTSSDPEVAEPDDDGTVTLKGTGTVRIEAVMPTGARDAFVLHIYDPLEEEAQKAERPEKLVTEEQELVMDKDAYRQIRVEAEPSFSDCDLLYSSDREEVASVDYFGVVHALSPGKARITVTCGDDPDLSLVVDVLVR